MSIALWTVVVAALLPVMTVGIAKGRGGRQYDNANPRRWLEQQEGLVRRADHAHRNHFEAFPLFAVAVVLGSLHGMDATRLDTLAVLFIAARIAYTLVYLANWSTLRSVLWTIGFLTSLAILILAGMSHPSV